VAEIHEINHAIEGIFNAISELFSMPITVSVFGNFFYFTFQWHRVAASSCKNTVSRNGVNSFLK
jgi:hypothetical protein